MAIQVATTGYLLINSVNLSAWCESIMLERDADEVDRTNFGDAGSQNLLGGILKGKLSIVLQQDYAAGGPDATIWPLLGTLTAIEIRPTSGARSATNPAYTGNVLVSKYQPFEAKVGAIPKISISLPISGALARQTS